MKGVVISQPWASAAVFGLVEVLNFTFKTRYRGPLLICAGRFDARVAGDPKARQDLANPLMENRHNLLGIVHLDGVVDGDECQLPYAFGPRCWLVSGPLIFPEPIPRPGGSPGAGKGLFDLPERIVGFDEINDAETPGERRRRIGSGLGPEEGLTPSRDGWTGD